MYIHLVTFRHSMIHLFQYPDIILSIPIPVLTVHCGHALMNTGRYDVGWSNWDIRRATYISCYLCASISLLMITYGVIILGSIIKNNRWWNDDDQKISSFV
eukprot:GHVO01047832.1.p1 GENE.GHVO01047832.1~~GHVO01047832.1.p1  ORF type:complete len:101 (-),score=9.17 GHVO01047832.1:109-411(-)